MSDLRPLERAEPFGPERGSSEVSSQPLAPYRPPRWAETPVDGAGVRERVAALGKRSLQGATRGRALALAIRMVDLTTLEGKDTPGKVLHLCRKAKAPCPTHPGLQCAAVCVYPSLVRQAKQALLGTTVKLAVVATAFPSGLFPLDVKLADVHDAVKSGADEIDMVIDRGALLAGRSDAVFHEIAAVKAACGAAHLKVILETGELGSLDLVRRASCIAMLAGADFIKTSTGKIPEAATPEAALVMLEAIRDHYDATGKAVGLKVAGGIRRADQALHYLVIVAETLGDTWITADRFRIGASTLLNDLVFALERDRLGTVPPAEHLSRE